MPQRHWTSLLGLTTQILGVLARPQTSSTTAAQLANRADAFPLGFAFGAIGDSWASGITYEDGNKFDSEDPENCQRYKYAWSTVVNASYDDWIPNGYDVPVFEFKACSGAHLGDDLMHQMSEMTSARPKVVLMEAGGNNADFYPMADSCLFHSDRGKNYSTKYEDDNPDSPTGECRREINLVRDRTNSDEIKNNVTDTIWRWMGHDAVVGNDASLFVLGYPQFFGYSPDCDGWTFNVFYNRNNPRQNVVMDMRKDFNALIDRINTMIREAVESFNDPKIQYIDINPAFNFARFCEIGHTFWDQFNWSNAVHIWNSPGSYGLKVTMGSEVKTYDTTTELPPQEIMEMLIDHPDGEPRQEGDNIIQSYHNPDNPDLSMEITANPKDFEISDSNSGGSIHRTLHPTQEGHKEMGDKIVEHLKQVFQSFQFDPDKCPTDCTCGPAGTTC